MALATLTERPLAPLYPSFPEKGYTYANVLCEGPSILRVLEKDLLPGPTIAINHALALSWRLPVDFWATVDHPKILWDWSEPYRPEGLKVFSTENNVLFWIELLGEDGFDRSFYGCPPTYMDHMETAEVKAPVLPTVMPVVAWLFRQKTIRHVRLFGCDMVGQNSPLSAVGFQDVEDEGWEYRWTIERQLIYLATLQYRSRGKRLDRWDRVRHSSRNLLSWWSKTRRQEKSY